MSFPIISSNTLFHFASKREYLVNILTNNFRPRYCLESVSCLMPDVINPDLIDIAIPMTCFCDIPLSNIGKHLETYGNYGIGLTKEWGMKNGLNPILYVHENSSLWKAIDDSGLATTKLNQFVGYEDLIEEVIRGQVTLRFNYLKPYVGDFLRNGEVIKNVKFYDEREWRYVPIPENNEYYQMRKKDFDDLELREQRNTRLPQSATLEFDPNDVKYIVVENEDEISSMVDEIMSIKEEIHTRKELKVLTTRIISAEQIKEDF